MAKLSREQIVTIEVLHQRGQSATQTARILGVTEGAVRYHRRRFRDGATDGRRKPSRVERLGLEEAVALWWHAQLERLGDGRPPSVQLLHDFLRSEHGYGGSYKSVRKFVRARYGAPRVRPFRRVETPPGYTVREMAELLEVDPSWISRKIGRGQILLEKDPCYKCYLFPRTRSAVAQMKQLRNGKLLQVSFPKEHCDG